MIYNSLLLLSLLYVLPKWLTQRKYRGTIKQRLGLKLPPEPTQKQVIWIHMCSVGETKAMTAIYEKLRDEYPQAAFYLSSTTKTGHEEAKRSLPNAAAYFFLPLDLSWITESLAKRLNPTLFILSEGEFWPNTIASVKKRGGKVLLLNGKLSEKSAKRFAHFPKFSQPLFDKIDHFFIQSKDYANRFQSLNIPSSKILVTGNLKLFNPPPPLNLEQIEHWRAKWGLKPDDFVITLASTHAGEEEALLFQIPPHAKVLIAPRHPERFAAVKKLLHNPHHILIDQMGILPICYHLSQLAIVGGSFIPGVGGHNIFEPIQAQIPVIFGPFMETQQELVTLILNAQAGLQVPIDKLPQAIEQALTLEAQVASLASSLYAKKDDVLKQILPHITCA